MSQLQNRFGPEVEQFWRLSSYYYECFNKECEHQNHADCTHHIISPTASAFIKGDHNESIFNSCRLNNEKCHLYRAMQNIDLQKEYLKRTAEIVAQAVENGEYYLTKKDYTFLRVYKDMYDLSTLSLFDFPRVGMVK